MIYWVGVAAVSALMMIGILGTLVPILPGLLLEWATALGFVIVIDSNLWHWAGFGLISALCAWGLYLGVRIPQRESSDVGMSRWEQVVAVACAIVGTFVVPVAGTALGYVIGVFAMRRRAAGDNGEAWQSTVAVLKAMLRAAGAQALVGIGMYAVFIVIAVTAVPD